MGNSYRKFKRIARKRMIFAVVVNFMFLFFLAGFLFYVASLIL